MRPDVTRWSQRRSSFARDWDTDLLRAVKHRDGLTVSVVLPALDEQSTVGAIVSTLIRDLVAVPQPLVDEVVVMDSGSRDGTAAAARAAGARVVQRTDVLPEIPIVAGKGEVLWRSLAATDSDLLVFVDADLHEFDSRVVTGLLGPLLTDGSVQLVKGCYDRPLREGDSVLATGGGRVTELVARPLLNLHWPELAGVVQPLVGEYAARRTLLERLPFPTGYGVELALLIDALDAVGLDALAQVDLGVRRHEHQDELALGRMSAEIWQTALRRIDSSGRLGAQALSGTLTQFTREGDTFVPTTTDVTVLERPPMADLIRELQRQAS